MDSKDEGVIGDESLSSHVSSSKVDEVLENSVGTDSENTDTEESSYSDEFESDSSPSLENSDSDVSTKKKKKRKKKKKSKETDQSTPRPSPDRDMLSPEVAETRYNAALDDLRKNTPSSMWIQLSKCRLNDKKIKKICDALTNNDTVISIDLSHNCLSDASLHNLSETLCNGCAPDLISLNLKQNSFTENGKKVLDELKISRKLIKVELDGLEDEKEHEDEEAEMKEKKKKNSFSKSGNFFNLSGDHFPNSNLSKNELSGEKEVKRAMNELETCIQSINFLSMNLILEKMIELIEKELQTFHFEKNQKLTIKDLPKGIQVVIKNKEKFLKILNIDVDSKRFIFSNLSENSNEKEKGKDKERGEDEKKENENEKENTDLESNSNSDSNSNQNQNSKSNSNSNLNLNFLKTAAGRHRILATKVFSQLSLINFYFLNQVVDFSDAADKIIRFFFDFPLCNGLHNYSELFFKFFVSKQDSPFVKKFWEQNLFLPQFLARVGTENFSKPIAKRAGNTGHIINLSKLVLSFNPMPELFLEDAGWQEFIKAKGVLSCLLEEQDGVLCGPKPMAPLNFAYFQSNNGDNSNDSSNSSMFERLSKLYIENSDAIDRGA